jgi:hypothetical protein
MLLNAICVGCKFLSTAVRRAGVAGTDVLGKAGTSNVQGEDQKKLDLVANEVFKNVLRKSGQCCVLVTEEEDDPVFIEPPYRGDYCVVFDPLDGSSNIECGVSIGTIFGIYKVKNPGSKGSVDDVLRVSVSKLQLLPLESHLIHSHCPFHSTQTTARQGDGGSWVLHVRIHDGADADHRGRGRWIHTGFQPCEAHPFFTTFRRFLPMYCCFCVLFPYVLLSFLGRK